MKRVPAFILIFFVCDMALTFVYLLDWGLRRPFATITLLIGLDDEANLPTWYSSIQLFGVATFLAIFASAKLAKQNILSWTLLLWPFMFLALSIDETAQIHEYLGWKSDILLPGGSRKNSLFPQTGIWMFLFGIPCLLFMESLLYSLKKYLRGNCHVTRLFFAAVIVYVGSATGLEVVDNFVPANGWLHVLQVCFEELGEMIGTTLFLWASYELLNAHGFSMYIPKAEAIRETVEQQVGTIAA